MRICSDSSYIQKVTETVKCTYRHMKPLLNIKLVPELDGRFLVMLEVSKYNSCKDFSLNRSSCCCSCSTQNPCCASTLHKASMVHSMSTTRNGELQILIK